MGPLPTWCTETPGDYHLQSGSGLCTRAPSLTWDNLKISTVVGGSRLGRLTVTIRHGLENSSVHGSFLLLRLGWHLATESTTIKHIEHGRKYLGKQYKCKFWASIDYPATMQTSKCSPAVSPHTPPYQLRSHPVNAVHRVNKPI
jgi:hypothetical protein